MAHQKQQQVSQQGIARLTVPKGFMWTFRCYVDARGANPVGDWLGTLSAKGRANLKRALEHLRQKHQVEWERPHSSPLGNNIYVIRFKDENRTQWRIYGEHEPARSCFVFTNSGTERGGVYDPPSSTCCSIASKRMVECRNDWDGRTCGCVVSTADGVTIVKGVHRSC